MSKKFVTMVLVALLAMTCVFAYKGEIKVGLNAGVGSDNAVFEASDGSKVTCIILGANVTGSVHYGLSDSSYVKLELGLNTYNEAAFYVNDTQVASYTGIEDERKPNCVYYLGYVYNMPLGRNGIFEWEFGAGLQGMLGSCLTSNDFNFSLGIGVEETMIFNITNNIAITATTRSGVQILNTNKELKDFLSGLNLLSIPVYFTAGVTYSL